MSIQNLKAAIHARRNAPAPDRVKVWHLEAPLAYADAYRVTIKLREQGAVASDPDPVRDNYGRLRGYDIKYIPRYGT